MEDEDQEFQRRALEHAVHFFSELSGPAPPILREAGGGWYSIRGGEYTGLVVAGPEELGRAQAHEKSGKNPLMGIFAPPGTPGAIALGGRLTLVRSNVTQGGYAFSVQPDVSAIIEDHHHTARIAGGDEVTVQVELMFLVGDAVGDIERRVAEFEQLFRILVTSWRNYSGGDFQGSG